MLGMRKKTKLARAAETAAAVTAGARRSGAAVAKDVDAMLGTLADTIADARASLSTMAEDGALAARSALATVVKESRAGVKRADKKWKKMETKQKVAVVGAVLAALAAAAAAPAVVRKVRKRR